MDKDTIEGLQGILTTTLLFGATLFLPFAAVHLKKYSDANRGKVLGEVAFYIATGIEQKYGAHRTNEQKKELAKEALENKDLRKDLLIEAGVHRMKEEKKAAGQ